MIPLMVQISANQSMGCFSLALILSTWCGISAPSTRSMNINDFRHFFHQKANIFPLGSIALLQGRVHIPPMEKEIHPSNLPIGMAGC